VWAQFLKRRVRFAGITFLLISKNYHHEQRKNDTQAKNDKHALPGAYRHFGA
jgi:hypothetical protein